MSKRVVLVGSLVLVVALAAPAAVAEEGMPRHVMVMPDQLEWSPVASLPEGATAAVLDGDPAQEGEFILRLRLPPNYSVPLHTHPTTERVTVLEGTFHLGVGQTVDRAAAHALSAGGLAVMESGVAMFGFTGDDGALLQINADGPWGIDYLDPAEDPRQQAP